jgi:hypothetical protein
VGCHDVGQEFNLAAATKAAQLLGNGDTAFAARVSSVQDFDAQLTTNGLIDGGVIYFGHGGYIPINGTLYSGIFPGQSSGLYTNITALTVGLLSGNMLGPKATVTLNACFAGAGANSIAQLVANQLNVKVYAYPVGMFFSSDPNATKPPASGTGPQTTPAYMLPWNGVKPVCFAPHGLNCVGSTPP